jgi:uncharacterized membrane protein
MDATHLHLLLNHFPIIGTLVGTGVILYGYLTRSEQTKQAALWIWTVMAAIAIPVFLTGEPAEEAVENIAGVSESIMHEHEEAAELAIWLMEALGLLSLFGLVLTKIKPASSKTIFLVAGIFSLVVFGSMARTGYLGGQIRHSEIRTASAAMNVSEQEPAGGEAEGGGEEEEEEDED